MCKIAVSVAPAPDQVEGRLRRESSETGLKSFVWIPAFAGMTKFWDFVDRVVDEVRVFLHPFNKSRVDFA